jgi:hypothetical protein
MNYRLLLSTIIALGLTACVRTPSSAVLKTSTVKAGSPAPALKSNAPLTLASESSAAKDSRVVRLSGTAIAGDKLEAKTANVKNGYVVGSPLQITEAATGRLIKQGVTYFDGSFQLDLTAPTVSTPAVVSVELVDAKDAERTFKLEAPLMLEKGITQVSNISLDAGTTAMVMLYRAWAQTASSAAKPGSLEFARYVSSTSADTTRSFGVLVAQDAAIPAATDVASLQAAIEAYVEHSSRGTKTYVVKRGK